jgi:predicted ribosomally synthesized peptide with SipW-like signal peptide
MNRKLKIISVLGIILALASVTAVAAILSDTESSNYNTFTAGTLDLTLNGENGDNVAIFAISHMRPGSQPTGAYNLQNIGSLSGTLSISSITVEDIENDLTEPETEAGDITSDVGELGSVVNIRLYVDTDKDGYYSTGDVMLYNGKISDLPSTLAIGTLGAGATTRVNAVVDWWSTSSDNLAQSDSCVVNFTFSLVQ